MVNDSRVCNDLGRRRVENNVVILLAQIFHQSIHLVGKQQLGCVRRCLLAHNIVEERRSLTMHNDVLEVLLLAQHVADETQTVVAVNGLRQAALTQVTVHQDSLLTQIRQRQRQVQCHKRLTLTWHCRHGLNDLLILLQEEWYIGMQYSERLRHHICAISRHDNLIICTTFRFLRYFTQNGYGNCSFNIRLRTQLHIKEIDKEHYQSRQCCTENQTHQNVHRQVRPHIRTCRRFHNLGRHYRHSQIHCVLLTFAQQIEEQFLFNLLLTRHLSNGFALGGKIINLTLSTSLLCSGSLQADVGRIDKVVY